MTCCPEGGPLPRSLPKKLQLAFCSTDGKIKCLNTFSGYECGCGNCYNEVIGKNGERSCKPKCNLKTCDEATGICGAGSSGQ